MVSHVVRTMHDIHDSSQRIRDIVFVIDSIALKANILALNAVETAAATKNLDDQVQGLKAQINRFRIH